MVWVNPDLFFEGFKAAIDAHEGQYSGKVDLALLEASFDAAMRNDGHAAQPRRNHRPRLVETIGHDAAGKDGW